QSQGKNLASKTVIRTCVELNKNCKENESLKAFNALLMEQIDLQLPPATPVSLPTLLLVCGCIICKSGNIVLVLRVLNNL
ncbi:hypothetical protein GIB67_019663, partial [Kingdonia uniflora]